MTWYVLLVVAVGVERLVELVVAQRNLAWSRARGGVEFGARHYPVMVVLHTGLLFGAYSGGFTFNGTVMEVDLLGAHGESLSAHFGYIEHDGTHFRVAECNIPVIITDLWTQGA